MSESETSREKADRFLSIASQYKLGKLVTESENPLTGNLSELSVNNLPEAVSILKGLDSNTISILCEKQQEICSLKEAIALTLRSGNNVFFCGCGATGRLSLTIETLWRQVYEGDLLCDRVFSFMAGGDVALIRSIENFEDFPDYGGRQLIESGFRDGDLLVGTTEGGETPFVIGAVELASRISSRKPYFLYCNPDDILSEVAERSRRVIQNPGIEKINLTVGPMAITGSTRMQSSTILLAAAGLVLLYYDKSAEELGESLRDFSRFWDSADLGFLPEFTKKESDIYQGGDYLLYETDDRLGITVITDTTERSPTFSLFPFENVNEPAEPMSLCYLCLPGTENSEKAWNTLLRREPRTLEWPEIGSIASRKRLLGFDFSSKVADRRESKDRLARQYRFKITAEEAGIRFELDDCKHFLPAKFESPLFLHLVLKMILNTHSTLIMGRLGRYQGNVMTYVRASNNKLIDRSIRYIDMILKRKNLNYSYSELCHILFEMLEKTASDKSIVLTTVEEIERRNR